MAAKKSNRGSSSLSRVIFFLFATFLVSPNTILAQQPAIAKACAADVKLLCAGVQPGGGRLEACIKAHSNDLSEECRTALLKAATIGKVCAADVKQNCAGIKPGGGRIETCIKAHLADVSDSCKEALGTTAPNGR